MEEAGLNNSSRMILLDVSSFCQTAILFNVALRIC